MNPTRNEKSGKFIGASATLIVHALLFLVGFSTIVEIDAPPPKDEGILIDFSEPEIKPIQVKAGSEPKAINANPEKEIRLIQKSEGQEIGETQNKGMEATMGEEGDIEKPEPVRPKPINQRALFSSANNSPDTLSPQTADKKSLQIAAGNPQGNTRVGDTDGEPSARLEGRSVMGSLPYPTYNVNKAGRVVVLIRVDQYGKVISARAGVDGTTVQDKTLWDAAADAALKAKFNVSSKAATVQEGTITYVFRLK